MCLAVDGTGREQIDVGSEPRQPMRGVAAYIGEDEAFRAVTAASLRPGAHASEDSRCVRLCQPAIDGEWYRRIRLPDGLGHPQRRHYRCLDRCTGVHVTTIEKDLRSRWTRTALVAAPSHLGS